MTNKTVPLVVIAAAMLSSLGCTKFYDQYGENGRVRLRTLSEQPIETTPLAVGFDAEIDWMLRDGVDASVTLSVDPLRAVLGKTDASTTLRPLVAGDVTLRFLRDGNEIDRFVMHAVDVPSLDFGTADMKPRVIENGFFQVPFARPTSGRYFDFNGAPLAMTPRFVGLDDFGYGYARVTTGGSLVYEAGSATRTIEVEAVKLGDLVDVKLQADEPVLDTQYHPIWRFPIHVQAFDAVGPVKGAQCNWPLELNDRGIFFIGTFPWDLDAVMVRPGETWTATCAIGSVQRSITLTAPPKG